MINGDEDDKGRVPFLARYRSRSTTVDDGVSEPPPRSRSDFHGNYHWEMSTDDSLTGQRPAVWLGAIRVDFPSSLVF